jgi:Virulence factor membrane-bound polymerase, C-terminal
MYFDNAHNFILQLAVELGLIRAGLIVFVPVMCLYIFKPWQKTNAAQRVACVVFLLLIIHSLLEMPLWHPKFLLLFGLCMGTMFSVEPTIQKLRPALLKIRNILSSPWTSRLYATILIGLTILVAKDYIWVSQSYLNKSMRLQQFAQEPLAAAKDAVFFVPHADFAKLSFTETSNSNAREINELANRLLHFEAVPIVVGALIESYWLLDEKQDVIFHANRYKMLNPSMYNVSMLGWGKKYPLLFDYLQNSLPASH